MSVSVFFFNDTATTEIYTLSLHDALPISALRVQHDGAAVTAVLQAAQQELQALRDLVPDAYLVTDGAGVIEQANANTSQLVDRKSTRLNSSHANISYAVFCLKKKNNPSYA